MILITVLVRSGIDRIDSTVADSGVTRNSIGSNGLSRHRLPVIPATTTAAAVPLRPRRSGIAVSGSFIGPAFRQVVVNVVINRLRLMR